MIDRLVLWRQTIDGAGHVPHLTAPERYAETIVAFIREAENLVSQRA